MIKLLSIALVAYLAFAAFLYFAQRSMIFYPVPESSARGADALWIDTGEASIKVWRVGALHPQALLYFGGNAENVAFNAPDFARTFPDRTVYLVNHRGYGGSTGSPSEAALYHDALVIYDRLRETHRSMAVMGRSLGSAVAVHLAAMRKPERVVLITPFDSVASVAAAAFPIFPVDLLLRDRFDALADARDVTAPTLIVLASDDEVIPRVHSNALAVGFQAVTPTVEIIARTGHNTIGTSARYLPLLQDFLRVEVGSPDQPDDPGRL